MTEKREKPLKIDMPFAEALTRFAATRPGKVMLAIQAGKQLTVEPSQGELQLVHYQSSECITDFTLDPTNETVWATEQQIAALFDVQVPAISKHITDIYGDGELVPQGTFSKLEIVSQEGQRTVKRMIDHYNLDVILSVGYRVNSKRATEFRKFATRTLKDYLVQGFAINEARLRDDPNALRELAAKVRALRSEEKNIYKSVRDVFAIATSDYSKDTPDLGRFFARLQDKFTYAITGQLSSEVLLERANHLLENMGLTSMAGSRPSHADVQIAKNYLDQDELYALHMLCEHFLLFIESAAIRGMKLTMNELLAKFDDLAKVIGHPVFHDYKEALAVRAKRHACIELERYQQRLLMEKNSDRKKLVAE